MQPYYDHGGITIYHGDCRDVLPGLAKPEIGAVVTDPPYGLDYQSGRSSYMYGDMAAYREKIANDDDTSARDQIIEWAGDVPCLIFGSWKVTRPPTTRALLIWDKGEASGMGDLSIPWKPSHEEIYVIGTGFHGHRGGAVLRAYVPARVSMGRLHPNEKPVKLLVQLIQKCPAGAILDPFMGSGSTLRAAKNLGRRAIGIELEERYCEVAARRLSQEVMEFA